MKLAYADPPYLGQGARKYGKLHPEAAIWDEVKAHTDLLAKLAEEYDGWAFSLHSPSLIPILQAGVPEGTRVASWVKPFASWKPTHRVQYTWEPVLFIPSRPKGGKHVPSVRDFVSANITMRKGLPGAKPDTFNDWILDLIGWQPGDEFDDLFPGTGGMAEAIARRELPA